MCNHYFCSGCWEGYVAAAISEGPSSLNLRCPLPDCKAAVCCPAGVRLQHMLHCIQQKFHGIHGMACLVKLSILLQCVDVLKQALSARRECCMSQAAQLCRAVHDSALHATV